MSALRTRAILSALLVFLAPNMGEGAALKVAVVSDGSPGARAVEERIWLDSELEEVPWRQADVIWLLGVSPTKAAWRELLGRVRQGAGLVLVLGEEVPDLSPLGLRAAGRLTTRTSAVVRPGAQGPLVTEVVWPSAPQVVARLRLRPGMGAPSTLVETQEGREPLLLAGTLGRGRVLVLAVDLTHAGNRELRLWPYAPYLLHALGAGAAGRPAVPFAKWAHSPVPGPRALGLLMTLLGVMWLLTIALFLRARRHSLKHPEVLETFLAAVPPAGAPARPTNGWREVGFARPLAGFLTLAGTLFLLFAPYFYVTNVLIPNSVQPFPQAKGIWDFAWEALQIAWFLFDAGTFVAFVKYFAEYRVKDPAEALKSAQFFVWWQILTGLVQVTMASIVAVTILPHTPYGYASNFVILIALSQYPGFFGVITFFFQAYQRFDYNIGLDLLSDWVLRFALMIPSVLLFREWGAANPAYGEALGAALGIGVGFYLSTLVTFGVGVLLYRRLGLRLLPLFLIHFDLRTAKRMLRYGLKVVAGQAAFRAAKTIDRVVISALLAGYTEWLGIEGQIHYHLMFLFPVAYRFFETAMAALSESHGNDKPQLTRYYLVRFFQVGSLYSAIGLSLLLALGPAFVRTVMDPQWARAADYLVIAAVIGAFYAPAWISDMLQKGAGRPGLFALVLGLEQAARIGLFFVFIPLFHFNGFYLALLVTIVLKVAGAWIANHRLIIKLRVYPWQMFVAPALAGLLNYFLLRGISSVIQPEARTAAMLMFFGAALLSFFSCFFFCGLLGGFDRAFADELDRASRMTGPLQPLTRAFAAVARAGMALSPLHDRFPVTIEAEAAREADELGPGL